MLRICISLICASLVAVGCKGNAPSTASKGGGNTLEKTQNKILGRKETGSNPKFDPNFRLSLKRGYDPDAAKYVGAKPVETTVETILSMVRPAALSGPEAKSNGDKRFGPLETSIWRISATLKEVVLRSDGDFYMVIAGDSGAETVVELPDPNLCKDSPFHDQIAEARKIVEARYHPTEQPQTLNDKVTFTGLGFFGRAGKDQNGKETNGARLMPVIGVQFGK